MFFAVDSINCLSATACLICELRYSSWADIAGNCSVMDLLCKRCMKSSERRNKLSSTSKEQSRQQMSCCQLDSVAENLRVNPKKFFGELKRRNVYKVAIAYAVVAWLLMQIATQVFPFLEIPKWAIRLV